jgi:4-hydroxy-tetrahydrodipicolinate synthase
VALYRAYKNGDIEAARAVQMAMLPRIRSLFVESNPVPVKYALYAQGVIAHDAVRSPLTSLSESSKAVVDSAFANK